MANKKDGILNSWRSLVDRFAFLDLGCSYYLSAMSKFRFDLHFAFVVLIVIYGIEVTKGFPERTVAQRRDVA